MSDRLDGGKLDGNDPDGNDVRELALLLLVFVLALVAWQQWVADRDHRMFECLELCGRRDMFVSDWQPASECVCISRRELRDRLSVPAITGH